MNKLSRLGQGLGHIIKLKETKYPKKNLPKDGWLTKSAISGDLTAELDHVTASQNQIIR